MTDQLTPNILTVNPDGTIGAQVTGHVKAAGIDLTAVPGDFQTKYSDVTGAVNWYTAQGALVAQVEAYDDSGLGYQSGGIVAGVFPASAARDFGGAGSSPGHAAIEVRRSLLEGGDGSVRVSASQRNTVTGAAPKSFKLLLDSAGQSDFLRLAATASKRLAISEGPIAWPGASAASSQVTFTHNLNNATAFFAFFMLDQSGTGPCYARGYSRSANACTADFVTGGFQPTAGNHGTWGAIAIG